MRATSARTFERVKIWRGASLISGRILSSLSRLLPSRMIRLIDRVFLDVDRYIAVIVADAGIGEQLGRVEIFQRLVSRGLGISPADAQLDVAEHRFRARGAARR